MRSLGLLVCWASLSACSAAVAADPQPDGGFPMRDPIPESTQTGKLGLGRQAIPATAEVPGALAQPVGVIQWEGDVLNPRMVTVSVYTGGPAGVVGGGPLVGVASWSGGLSELAYVEFDLGVPAGTPGDPNAGVGTIISLPCSALNVGIRNDALFAPRPGDQSIGLNIATGISAWATMAIGGSPTGGGGKLRRTIWAINNAGAGAGLAPAAAVLVPIPAFATAYQVVRFSAAQTVSFRVAAQAFFMDGPYNVAANTPAPKLDIPIGSFAVEVTNTGAAQIDRLAIIFDLSL